jgi:hypothetical protein
MDDSRRESLRHLAEAFHAESGILSADVLVTVFSVLDVLVEYRDAQITRQISRGSVTRGE